MFIKGVLHRYVERKGSRNSDKKLFLIVALYEELITAWGQQEKTVNSYTPDQNMCDYDHLYRSTMDKRVWRRKSASVRQYEDIDEYVDNMYLNE